MMPDDLKLRAARQGEVDTLTEVMKASIRCHCVEAYGQDTVDAWTDENTSRFEFLIPEHSFVAEFEGEIVAFSGWRPQEGAEGLARITAVFVAPGKDRGGFGGAVTARVERHIADCGFNRVHLFASLNAVPFYLSMGYQETERKMLEVAEGRHIEVVRMTRDVEAMPGSK